MTHISHLTLQNVRSYGTLQKKDLNPNSVILCGPNGVGKTNILEAISFLSPGRGLWSARISEIQNSTILQDTGWAISSTLETNFGPVQIGIGRDQMSEKKIIRINGQSATQAALGEWLTCLWLTPQMDRLFLDSASHRRRFFDRLIYTFDPAHLGRLTRYENAMRQRLKLLKESRHEEIWLTGLESQMAESALSITASRLSFNEKLQQAYILATREEKDNFPKASLKITGHLEDNLAYLSALDTEDRYIVTLNNNRAKDRDSGITHAGPHRSDFDVTYTHKNMPAASCSTGEQKALLIGIILAHARLLSKERGAAPILLLDEVVAHLDPSRRKVLADILSRHTSQIWMSGTDRALFQDFSDFSDFLDVSASDVT